MSLRNAKSRVPQAHVTLLAALLALLILFCILAALQDTAAAQQIRTDMATANVVARQPAHNGECPAGYQLERTYIEGQPRMCEKLVWPTAGTITIEVPAPPNRQCAFGLKPQRIWAGPTVVQPTKKQEMFPQPPSDIVALATVTWPTWSMRWTCPYERAIEKYGEERVTLTMESEYRADSICAKPSPHGCLVDVWYLAVDSEVVYAEEKK